MSTAQKGVKLSMFKRRKPLTLLQQLRQIYWPSMGWPRMCRYILHRTIRISDTTHKIAMGLAIGGAISFSPLIFTHIIQGLILAIFLRGNFIAVAIGTIIGNPWTFPFIWWASMNFGSTLFGLAGLPSSTALPDDMSISILWDLIKNEPFRIFAPWMVGGYLITLITLPILYVLYYNLVRGAKLARQRTKDTARRRKEEKTQ